MRMWLNAWIFLVKIAAWCFQPIERPEPMEKVSEAETCRPQGSIAGTLMVARQRLARVP